MKSFLFLLTCFAFNTVSAETSSSQSARDLCPDKVERFGNIQLQQQSSREGFCYLSIHPRNAYQTMIYRDYLLSTEGLLMVFNSFSPEESPETTGAREFFFFPREFKGYQWEVQGDSLIVRGFREMVFQFNLKTSQIESISGAKIEVKPEVAPENQGGVEILSFNNLFMDSGFTTGNSPSAAPSRSSVWKNSQNQECKLRNSEAFLYRDGEPSMKSEKDMLAIIRRKCPQFNLL